MQHDVEVIGLTLIAAGLTGGILLAIGDTDAYPIAIGIELVVIAYYILGSAKNPAAVSIEGLVSKVSGFIAKPGSYAQ